jgi:hypothetical protein
MRRANSALGLGLGAWYLIAMRTLALVAALLALGGCKGGGAENPLWTDTTLTVEERIGDCKTHACIVEAGEAFPSLCHLKAHGRFTRAVVECDSDCKWLRRTDPDTFHCWRVEACHSDPECARLFEVE